MFTAALFVIAKSWKLPQCLSTGEWINKLWCIHIMANYSAVIKRNELLIYVMTRTNFKVIMQIQRSQTENIYCTAPLM